MSITRRRAVSAMAAMLATSFARASDAFPSRPVTIVVPWAAGGGVDIVARNVAQGLGPILGQPVIVDNKAGAAGLIGAKYVIQAPADGYTLLLGSLGPNMLTPAAKDVGFDPLADLRPIALLSAQPMVLLVSTTSPYLQFADLTKAAATKSLAYASAGVGSVSNYIGEVLNTTAGLKVLHVPYRGTSPALVALQAGEVQLYYALASDAVTMVSAGKARALLVTSPERSPMLPDTPSLKEVGLTEPAVENWTGLFGPAKLPAAIVAKLNGAVASVLDNPSFREKNANLAILRSSSPEQFNTFMSRGHQRFRATVKKLNFTTE